MTQNQRAESVITGLLKRCSLRAPSLIVSVLGDSIAPHGGTFWIGSLISVMEPFGVNERLVRTAVFRLTKEDWLTSIQIGRRSYYSLTHHGLKRFEQGFHRVYEMPAASWDGSWSLVMIDPNGLAPELRERARQELSWAGFGMAAPFVFAHTAMQSTELSRLLDDLTLSERAVVMNARLDQSSAGDNAMAMVRRCWDLDRLSGDYRQFLELFRPLWQTLRDGPALNPAQSFLARTLLIHEYRRISLRDPQLPNQLLASDWEGTAARLLTRNLYRALEAGAEDYIMAQIETADGPLPGADRYYTERFGGL